MAITESERTYWKALALRFVDINSTETFNIMFMMLVKPFRGRTIDMPREVADAVVSGIYKFLKLDTTSKVAQACLVDAYFFTRNIRSEECNKAVYDAVIDKKLLQIRR